MVWRYACGFFRILKLFFITGFLLQYLGKWYRTSGPLANLPIFNSSNKIKAGDINSLWNFLVFIAPACSRVRYRCPIFCPSVRQSVRLSTFMSTFDIYVKDSILINYNTKQPSNLAWNISLTSWLCNIGIRFSICLSIRPSVCQHLCRSWTFMSKLVF